MPSALQSRRMLVVVGDEAIKNHAQERPKRSAAPIVALEPAALERLQHERLREIFGIRSIPAVHDARLFVKWPPVDRSPRFVCARALLHVPAAERPDERSAG